MKEHPLIFQDWGVRAILDGRKTMTRRIGNRYRNWKKGDLIWVKETWMPETEQGIPIGSFIYRATDNPVQDGSLPLHWKPSIFMPRLASRCLLEMTADAREERLQDITEEDAIKEGVTPIIAGEYSNHFKYRVGFQNIWDSINGEKPGYAWADNPFVSAIEFKEVRP